MAQDSTNQWNAQLYDTKMGFVSELGKGVLELLAPRPGGRFVAELKRKEERS
ncbi:MAG: hypothetical protein H0Z34_13045 [Brevibacillus sp.]|nr:hypothetical protein [Brevibacillus sp.]